MAVAVIGGGLPSALGWSPSARGIVGVGGTVAVGGTVGEDVGGGGIVGVGAAVGIARRR